MDYEKKQPTADCIVARLVPSWGSIVSLLFKTTEPYEHYYDEHGEEVPYGAIESWTDVELPPESEDERIKKTAIKILKGVAHKVFEHEGVSKESVLAYLEKQKEQEPAEIDEYEIIKKHITEDALSGEVNKRLKECGWYVTDENPAEWSEEEGFISEHELKVLKLVAEKDGTCLMGLYNKLKSLRPQPKQKHCDYITPHKKFFQWIYNRLIDVHHENPNVDYMQSFKERIDNLSFEETTRRKPSEEQIKLLDVAIAAILDNNKSSNLASGLITLRKDLEKLM